MPEVSGVALAVAASVIYTAGMAIAWRRSSYSYSDETAKLVRSIIPVLAVLSALAVAAYLVAGTGAPLQATYSWWALLGLAPATIMVAGLMIAFRSRGDLEVDWPLFWGSFGGALLVGIGEEVTFRGLALGGLSQQFAIPAAVALSCVLFGLLHSVNFLAGQSAGATAAQVLVTAVLGLIFAWTYVLSGGNLVLVIVLHCLYDFSLFAAPVVWGKSNPLAVWAGACGVAVAVALTVVGLQLY